MNINQPRLDLDLYSPGNHAKGVTHIPIDQLAISEAIKQKLIDAPGYDLRTIGDLIQFTDIELQKITNLRPSSVQKISDALSEFGVDLRGGGAGLCWNIRLIETGDSAVDQKRAKLLASRIEDLDLSDRTTNALINNGITTVAQLLQCKASNLDDLKGFGSRSRDEVMQLFGPDSDLTQLTVLIEKDHSRCQSLYEYMHSNCSEREIKIIELYNGLNDDQPVTGRALADQYSVTTSRMNQIVQKAERKIRKGFNQWMITPTILERCDAAIQQGGQRVDEISGLDNFYTDQGVIRLVCRLFPEKFYIFQGSLRHQWLISSAERPILYRHSGISGRLSPLKEKLHTSAELLSIADLAREYNLPAAMICDLDKYEVIDGQIGRTKLCRMAGVRAYMRQLARPVKVSEVSEHFQIPIESARNLLCSMEDVVNIGRSIYALTEHGYSNASTFEIVYKLLEEVSEPLPRQEIYQYVQHYREISNAAVDLVFYQNEDIFSETIDGKIALAEWGYSCAVKTRNTYDISAEEAVLNVINESSEPLTSELIRERIQEKYDDRASSKTPTVLAALSSLVEARQIRKLKLSQAAVYLKK